MKDCSAGTADVILGAAATLRTAGALVERLGVLAAPRVRLALRGAAFLAAAGGAAFRTAACLRAGAAAFRAGVFCAVAALAGAFAAALRVVVAAFRTGAAVFGAARFFTDAFLAGVFPAAAFLAAAFFFAGALAGAFARAFFMAGAFALRAPRWRASGTSAATTGATTSSVTALRLEPDLAIPPLPCFKWR